MNRMYELVLVFNGKITAAKKKAELEKIEKLISVFKGRIVKSEDWGVKDLAYTIKDAETGAFQIFTLELDGDAAKNLSGKIRLEENIIRYLLIKIEPTKEEKKAARKAKSEEKING